MKKLFALGMAAAMAATMLTGCNQPAAGGSSSTSTPEGETIKIGVLAPLTGNVAVYGTTAKNGIQQAIDEINAAGGIDGKQIELLVMDEKGDVNEAVNAYNMLVSKGIVALLGDVTSKPSIAVAELAAEDNIPMITPTGTAAEITTKGENVFRTCFLDPAQGEAIATFAKENMGFSKVALLQNPSDDYSKGLADAFKAKAAQVGLEIVADEGYGSDDKDFNTQFTTIIAAQPEAIFIGDYYNNAAMMAIQARSLGFEGAILGPDGFDGLVGAMPADQMEMVNNVFFTNHYSTTDESAVVQEFIANYKKLYSADPSAFAALGYDTAYIMRDAIVKAGSTDSDALIAALKDTSYEGVTGHITFDDGGDSVKSISVIEIVDGVYTLNAKVAG